VTNLISARRRASACERGNCGRPYGARRVGDCQAPERWMRSSSREGAAAPSPCGHSTSVPRAYTTGLRSWLFLRHRQAGIDQRWDSPRLRKEQVKGRAVLICVVSTAEPGRWLQLNPVSCSNSARIGGSTGSRSAARPRAARLRAQPAPHNPITAPISLHAPAHRSFRSAAIQQKSLMLVS